MNEARARIAVDSVCIVQGYFVVCAPLSSKWLSDFGLEKAFLLELGIL